MQQEVTKVCVTGGAGQVGYSLCFMIGAGRLLGPDRKIHLTIIEVPHANKVAEGLVMELKDCAFPLLAHVEYTLDPEAGFKGCDIALLVGARPRGPGMTRADLLKVNASIFKTQAHAIENNANKDCKILVVGNPANTNAAILAHYAPSLNKKNITSLTRLDMNRAKSLLAEKVGLSANQIHNVIIWGNHSNTQFPHVGDAYADTESGSQKLEALVNDNEWIQNEFISKVQLRGQAIIDMRGLSSAGSAASAICDHIYSWLVGTKEGEHVSMGVMSDGSYGVSQSLNFSFPVTCKDGNWEIVQGVNLSRDFDKEKFNATHEELKEELQVALEHLETPTN